MMHLMYTWRFMGTYNSILSLLITYLGDLGGLQVQL